jgi:biotin synthesis protein BioG
MNCEWLIQDGRERLILFFAGWGMDARPFRGILSESSDILVLFGYHQHSDNSMLADVCSHYTRCDVLAWSLGVVIAGHWCSSSAVSVSRVVALNGTPYPAHDKKGIPHERFNGTLDQLSKTSLQQFYRRMCHNKETLSHFLQSAPMRKGDDLYCELDFLRKQLPAPESCFTGAIVSSHDRIIPPENQRYCWREAGIPYRDIDAPHFLFDGITHWEELLNA